MSWIELIVYLLIIVLVIQVVRILLADCDLILQWKSKYGLSPETLSGKVVWITGASSGIGEHLAYELAKWGCRLVLSARRETELQRVKKQCLTQGKTKESDILVLPLDILNYDSHKEAADQVLERFGQIDVLVNNAGRSQRSLVKDTELSVDIDLLNLNVIGQISLTKAVLPHMLKRKEGQFVINSSIAGKLGLPNSADYCCAKYGILGYFEGLRCEVFPDNIHVCLVCPGPVFSKITDEAFTGKADVKHGEAAKKGEKRMLTPRCAELIAVAMANKLDEVWVSLQPFLLMIYASQYAAGFYRLVMRTVGMKAINRMREGQ